MADEENTVETPPLEPGQEKEAETTPPILPETAPTVAPTPHADRTVEVTRIPPPIVIGKLVVFPRAHGVDYTVNDKVRTQAENMRGGKMKVKAVPKQGYTFAKGLKQTFNLEA